MSFNLPPFDAGAKAAFATVAECHGWLGGQALTNSAQVQSRVREQLDLLNQQAISLRERFGILEALQPQIAFAQEEVSRRYAGKPLPLTALESDAFTATGALWSALCVGYLRCLEDALAGDAAELTASLQRALAVLVAAQLDRVRGFAQPDPGHWSHLHQLLALAEARGLTTVPVNDKERYGEQTVTPLAVYAEAMLLHAASAHEFSARPLTWVARWARRWGGKLTLLTAPPADLQAMPINVDLASSLPPTPFPIKNETARFLDTAELSHSIRSCLTLLAEGRTPAELQLGDDCTQPACGHLLQRLHQRWCKGGMQRPADRHAGSGAVELAAGSEAVWFQFAGNPFKQPRSADSAMLRREREELAAFGRISERHDTQMIDLGRLRAETGWQIVNEGPAGLRLMRAMTSNSTRIGVGQLIAVKKPGAAAFALGSVRWLMIDEKGALHVGAHLMSGATTPISFRNAGINAAKDPWRPAFVLADESPVQLVLPGGVFRAERAIDVEGGAAKHYKLAALLERGDDFERVQVA